MEKLDRGLLEMRRRWKPFCPSMSSVDSSGPVFGRQVDKKLDPCEQHGEPGNGLFQRDTKSEASEQQPKRCKEWIMTRNSHRLHCHETENCSAGLLFLLGVLIPYYLGIYGIKILFLYTLIIYFKIYFNIFIYSIIYTNIL